MNQKSLVVVVLVLIAALYLSSVGLGLHFNAENSAMPSQTQVMDSWVKSFRESLSFLTPNLLRCNGQLADEPFVLTSDVPQCDVELMGSRRPQVARVEILSEGVAVYRSYCGGDTRPGCEPETNLEATPRVMIEYLPEGQASCGSACWVQQIPGGAISFVVMGDGGQLKLVCEGCEAAEQSLVSLRLGGGTD